MELLIHTTAVARKEKIEGKGLSATFVQKYASVKCFIEPVSPQDSLTQNQTVGKDYRLYFAIDADVQQGDKLTTSTGLTLLVNGVASYKDVPDMEHLEVTATTQGD